MHIVVFWYSILDLGCLDVLQRFLDIQQHPNLLGIIVIIIMNIIIIIIIISIDM